MERLMLWLLVLGFGGAFLWQLTARVRLIAAAPNTLSLSGPASASTLHPRRRPSAEDDGRAACRRLCPRAGVLGFMAFAGYTAAEFLAGLGSST